MDPLAVVAGIAGLTALAGAGFGWRMRCRAVAAEAQAARLRRQLRAERHAASHDVLTGLPNRRAFYRAGSALIADPGRYPLVAVVVDLDDFKQINDRFGHAAGDEVLVTVARRLAGYAGDNLIARIGGDEFAGLLCARAVDQDCLDELSRRLAETLAAPMPVAGSSLTVSASIGLAPICRRVHLADALHHADAAMYRYKANGHRREQPAHRMTWHHQRLPRRTVTDAIGDAEVRAVPAGPAAIPRQQPPGR
jgi:diguanylate cyclase (GGDEF)-like protein